MKEYIGTCSDGATLFVTRWYDGSKQFYILFADVYYEVDEATVQQELRTAAY